MESAYEALKYYTDGCYSNRWQFMRQPILDLLAIYNIKPRQDDGELKQVNFSIAQSKKDTFVIGLRYLKKDNRYTEDHFIFFKEAAEPKKIKGKALDKILPEYKGSHIAQPDLTTKSEL